jgi:hypothetical protein
LLIRHSFERVFNPPDTQQPTRSSIFARYLSSDPSRHRLIKKKPPPPDGGDGSFARSRLALSKQLTPTCQLICNDRAKWAALEAFQIDDRTKLADHALTH